jgi:hypothetical protein
LPALLDRGAAALPALTSLALEANSVVPVVQRLPMNVVRRLFEERGLLARLTRLKVVGCERLPPLPGPPGPEHWPGGMLMEDLDVDVGDTAADADALAAWPMPRLRRLAFSSGEPAALGTLLRAPWAARLEDLRFSAWCFEAAKGVHGG